MYIKDLETDEVTNLIIGSAIEVHRNLGPGLLESVYEICLMYELEQRSLKVEKQLILPVTYKGVKLGGDYRIDLLIEDRVIVEIKTVKEFIPVHESQILSYLRLRGGGVGLLINFNVPLLKDGIKRVIL